MTVQTKSPQTAAQATTSKWITAAQTAANRIPPLWPLKHFVAVNPFLNMTGESFAQVAARMAKAVPGGMLINRSFFRGKYVDGQITEASLEQAIAALESTGQLVLDEGDTAPTLHELEAWLYSAEPTSPHIGTFADTIDRIHQSRWAATITEEISRWMGAYLDEGQAIWTQPWQGQSLFSAWLEAASIDRNAELAGLHHFRKFVQALPQDPLAAIEKLADLADTKVEGAEDWFHRELLSVGGWASCLEYRKREGISQDGAIALLAIRLAYDVALLQQFDTPTLRAYWRKQVLVRDAQADRRLLLHLVWQEALELTHADSLLATLKSTTETPAAPTTRASAQLVFCIDVRSEPMRRAIEKHDSTIETMGYAGFFGMPIAKRAFGSQHGTTHCPVIVQPPYEVCEAPADNEQTELEKVHNKRSLGGVFKSFKDSAVSCFSFVEAGGLNYSWPLLRDGFLRKAPNHHSDLAPRTDLQHESCGIPQADQPELAKGLVRALNLDAHSARLVVLCGHGASTKNNPYDSGLQCGACGGHSGDFNAKLAAQIMNDPAVRESLAADGMALPEDTLFLAGRHDTTTDTITLFDPDQIPASHRDDVARLEQSLATACNHAQVARAPQLGITETDPAKVAAALAERTDDWSQVRPEWGLAGNGAFIIAHRDTNKHHDLGGRAFLHHYESENDPQGAVLQAILGGPMVVGSWINLQYYASTANHQVFGSGNKVLHNVNGTHGVQLGNGGDLKSGLPLQSIHDGTNWVHEPVTLKVFVDAPADKVRAALDSQPTAKELVDNHWLRLYAADLEGGWTQL
ncbi:YbcC family protein [Sulfuriroseicoccus oceanibius]|uniref:Probable inorganic carbon transporter subunit DabA n=1 Tax=Sulfuriroseicoccus oceanibius TaxID=2707525 RepID=A0A6B3L3B0_9BACT|nr:DUF2309 domain-containing protein [Sulfuriroseicoccus oceanibius]QQL45566.1 DUF2309 domain-containing protein [Sulfuriroseicoccus oceanibius]